MRAKIAVIMPAYNCRTTIERAVDSVIHQTYPDWHLYIVNDASQEPLDDILNQYSTKYDNITVIKNGKNQGAAESRNIALRNSKEDIVAFLDSDDAWYQCKLQQQIDVLNKYKATITSYFYLSKKKNRVTYNKNSLTQSDFLKKKYRVCFSSLMHYRIDGLYFERIGHEDFVYIYNLFKKVECIYIVKDELVDYYDISASLSGDKKKAAAWHFNILKKLFPKRYGKQLIYFVYYALNGLLFKLRNK